LVKVEIDLMLGEIPLDMHQAGILWDLGGVWQRLFQNPTAPFQRCM